MAATCGAAFNMPSTRPRLPASFIIQPQAVSKDGYIASRSFSFLPYQRCRMLIIKILRLNQVEINSMEGKSGGNPGCNSLYSVSLHSSTITPAG